MKNLESKLKEKAAGNKKQHNKTLLLAGIGGVFVVALLFAFMAAQKHLGSITTEKLELKEAEVVQGTGTEREDFKKAIALFEKTVQPILDNTEIKSWDLVNHSDLAKKKEQALMSFASGQFSKALSQLEEATEKAVDLQSQWNEAFDKELNMARQYFEDGDVNRSKLFVANALKIKPSDSDGLKLKERIDVLPEVSKLIRKLGIAKNENNVQKQIRIIKEILALDPERSELSQQKKQLAGVLSESAFQAHIKKAFQAIENDDIESADKYYEKAKAIYPSRSELKLLAVKLGELKLANTLVALHRAIDQYRAQDDWESIRSMVQDAEGYYPNDPKLLEAKNDAAQILALKKESEIYTSRLDRINDANVRQAAMTYLRNAFPYGSKSESLKTAIKTINSAISTASQSYPVNIYSDNRTEITIKRVGIVGKTKERELQMSPGVYQVEGKRKGYKTVLKTLNVAATGKNSIVIECSEKI